MTRRAPAVERAVAVLNYLSSHPGERYSLSEIARDLTLNKATLHAILGALTDAGYLSRDPESKSYALGPALVALGNAALSTFSAADYALPEMKALTDELGLDCVASAAIHDEIVILARTGVPRPFGINVQPGQRLPLAPPLGTVFVAWSGDDVIDRYLDRVGPPASAARLERYRRAITAVRARGYSVGLEGPPPPRPRDARRGAHAPTLEESVRSVEIEEYALIDLDRASSYRLNHIGAPVFGPNGEVGVGLFLIGFAGVVPAERVPEYAARLRSACERVTKAVHGREPDEVPAG
ncbi:MAG TPA: IclR family transcriptional regulator [Actinomycetota bacterium]|nr:IclR family transcriptional regulator [Actinomycetota bacterium]